MYKRRGQVGAHQVLVDGIGRPEQLRDHSPHLPAVCSGYGPAPRSTRLVGLLACQLPDSYWVRWRPYEGQPSGSRLIRMAPQFDDGTLTVHVTAMYYWQGAAQAHRVVERGIPGEVVLIVDDDLAAALEV